MNKKVVAVFSCAFLFFFCTPNLHGQIPVGCIPLGSSVASGSSQSNTTEDCDYNNYRTINGTLNDLNNPDEGKAHLEFSRLFPADYEGDGSTMVDRGNPRTISNLVMAQGQSIPSQTGLNQLVFTFLQFLDHDITATEVSRTEPADIQIPAGDPEFDPFGQGQAIIPFTRSTFEEGTGTSTTNPRMQENSITSWIDGSVVYGSDIDRANWLRAFSDGKLKESTSHNGALLPYNTMDGQYESPLDPNAPFMDGDTDRDGNPQKVFVAGDVRANEQPGLTTLHTLFMKEHNRICDELIANGSNDDELNYQYARKMVGGILQSIVVYELLPTLGIHLSNDAYDPNLAPEISTEFATAAYRLGHTMIPVSYTHLTLPTICSV